tara:strand:- start:87 stop:380 length:294 start_codon:yes stop_codon:yes gene_type:complete
MDTLLMMYHVQLIRVIGEMVHVVVLMKKQDFTFVLTQQRNSVRLRTQQIQIAGRVAMPMKMVFQPMVVHLRNVKIIQMMSLVAPIPPHRSSAEYVTT